jgi:hypothetical protein
LAIARMPPRDERAGGCRLVGNARPMARLSYVRPMPLALSSAQHGRTSAPSALHCAGDVAPPPAPRWRPAIINVTTASLPQLGTRCVDTPTPPDHERRDSLGDRMTGDATDVYPGAELIKGWDRGGFASPNVSSSPPRHARFRAAWLRCRPANHRGQSLRGVPRKLCGPEARSRRPTSPVSSVRAY